MTAHKAVAHGLCRGGLSNIAPSTASRLPPLQGSAGCRVHCRGLHLLHLHLLLLCLGCLDGLPAPVVAPQVGCSTHFWQQLINQLQTTCTQ